MGEALAITAMVAAIAGAGYSAYNSYQTGKAQNAQAQAESEEMNRQARLEMDRAEIAQLQGEQEAEKRSRILAQDIGATYANWAGNGLLTDGAGGVKDSLTAVIKTQTAEGVADISNIRDNTTIKVWEHQSNAASARASALNKIVYGRNMKAAGVNSAIGSSIQGIGAAAGIGATAAKNYGWGANPTALTK